LLARLLALHKSRKDHRLVHYLAKLLVPMMSMIEADLLIPIPASQAGRRQRGYDQMVLLSMELSRQTGVPTRPILIRKKGTVALMKRSMKIESERIILLDDIYTTGKTSSDCRKILRDAFGINPFVVTIAES
jgi:competence protein ComFC